MADNIPKGDNQAATGSKREVGVPIRTITGTSSPSKEEEEGGDERPRDESDNPSSLHQTRQEEEEEEEKEEANVPPFVAYSISAAAALAPVAITEWWSSRPPISRALYSKAAEQNASLTRLERLYLLSRLDLPGKVLARPEETTPDETNTLFGRPPRAILQKNLREFFSYEHASSFVSSENEGEEEEGKQKQKDIIHPTSIDQVVDAYYVKKEARIEDLSFDALGCVAIGWWTRSQEKLPYPWELEFSETGDSRKNPRKGPDPGTGAASRLLGSRMREEEADFVQTVTERWLELDDGTGDDDDGLEETVEGVTRRLEEMVDDANALREGLCVEVRAQLEGLGEEERRVMEDIREKERRQVEKEDAEEREERKRKKEEEGDEKRKKRAKKGGKRRRDIEGADGDHVGGDEEDDSDASGYEFAGWSL